VRFFFFVYFICFWQDTGPTNQRFDLWSTKTVVFVGHETRDQAETDVFLFTYGFTVFHADTAFF
jgi:hypothetical protein